MESTEVTTMSSESSSVLDSAQRCATCGIHGFWTPRVWECSKCREYLLCENCHQGSQDFSIKVLPSSPRVQDVSASPRVHHRRSQDFSEVLPSSPLSASASPRGHGRRKSRKNRKRCQVHEGDYHMKAREIGAFCDGCGSDPIYNQRWHCTVCPDLDLCEACYGGLDAVDLPSEHLKEHPMIAVEVISSETLLGLRSSFTKPLDSQWAYKVKNNDLVTSGFVWAKRKPKAVEDNSVPIAKLQEQSNDNSGHMFFKQESQKSQMLNGMDDASIPSAHNAFADNSVPVSKFKEQSNDKSRNLFFEQGLEACQGMLDGKCKVFLSHAGTEKDFVKRLYQDLSKVHYNGIFFDQDDNLAQGELFLKRMFDAVKHCELAIVVISPEYFIHKWPMMELAAFAKAQKTRPKLKILPVFYKLSVEEFKKGQKSLKMIWNKLGLVSKDEIDKWEEALKVIDQTQGLEYDKRSGDSIFRDRIVEAVFKHVNPKLMWDDSHVQGKTQMQEMVQKMILISKDSSPEVPMVGTLRMGFFGHAGSGKTTMCKVLQNQMMPYYMGKVHHIEFGNTNVSHVRSKLLQSIYQLEPGSTQTVDEEQALRLLKTHIPKERVCLLIDNVSQSSIEEANILLDLPFKGGSLIVVTSQSPMILETFKIEKKLIMRIPSLTAEEAKSLFSHHAGCDTSRLTIEEMKAMESFVELCNFRLENFESQEYHPLALKVLGIRVGPNAEKWQNIRINLKYYENDNMHPIFPILRSSFDTLSTRYQRMFLDIALATSGCNVKPAIGGWKRKLHYLYDEDEQVVGVFQAKALVEFYDTKDETIYVHDLIREFARMEVEKKGSKHNVRCIFSRGSEHHHVVQDGRVLIHDHPISHISKETIFCKICLEAELLSIQDCGNLVSVDVPRMENLKMFHVISGCPELKRLNMEGAINLRSFVWLGFKRKFHSDSTNMESLEQSRPQNHESESPETDYGGLDFSRNSYLELLWLSYLPLKILNLSQVVLLKELNIKDCQHLEKFVGLEALALLEIINLQSCSSLVEFPSLENFPSLKEFFLEGAEILKHIQGLAKLSALRVFSLKGGSELKELPGIEACLKLSELWLSGTSIRDCSWISTMKDLTIIYLCKTKIRAVPDCSDLLTLFEIALDDCQALESIGVKILPQSVQIFSAKNCKCLYTLPEFQKDSALSNLNVSGTFVEDVSNVTHYKQLQRLHCARTQIISLPDLNNLSRLKVLDVHGCELLTSMDNIKSLPALERLMVYGCTSLRAPPNLHDSVGVTKLDLSGCPLVDPNVVKLPRASMVPIVMDYIPYYYQLDNDINAQECEDKTQADGDFEALEPTHNLERSTTINSWWHSILGDNWWQLVAMGGLLVWLFGRRRSNTNR